MSPLPQQPKTVAKPSEYLFAVLSDIHGNYAALRAVAADVNQMAKSERLPKPVYICLGDLVDYGPRPNECMAWVMRNRRRIGLLLRGNHDAEVCRDDWRKPERVGTQWWAITLWSRLHLAPRYRRLLAALPEVADGPPGLEDFHCYHSTPWTGDPQRGESNLPRDGYIDVNLAPERVLQQLGRTHIHGLCGHTHYQAMFVRNGNRAVCHYAQPENRVTGDDPRAVNVWHDFPDYRSTIINPGSVGQPRLHAGQNGVHLGGNDPRAAYLLLHRCTQDDESRLRFQWRRVPYALAETRDRLGSLAWTSSRLPAIVNGTDSFDCSEVEILKAQLPEVTANLVRFLGDNQGKSAE